MKWMGWSWQQYRQTPVSVVARVIELIQEEQAALEHARTTVRRR